MPPSFHLGPPASSQAAPLQQSASRAHPVLARGWCGAWGGGGFRGVQEP